MLSNNLLLTNVGWSLASIFPSNSLTPGSGVLHWSFSSTANTTYLRFAGSPGVWIWKTQWISPYAACPSIVCSDWPQWMWQFFRPYISFEPLKHCWKWSVFVWLSSATISSAWPVFSASPSNTSNVKNARKAVDGTTSLVSMLIGDCRWPFVLQSPFHCSWFEYE